MRNSRGSRYKMEVTDHALAVAIALILIGLIIDAGGWQSDTLTEDLDLSYRAQLKGWKFIYLENVGSPAELPMAMNALK